MRLVFFGRIHPERFPLTAVQIPYSAKAVALDFSREVILSIHSSQVIVQVSAAPPLPDYDTFKNLIESDVRSFVDYFGFIHGVRFEVDIISMVDETSHWRVFGIEIPVLKQTINGQQDELLRRHFSVAVLRPECSIVMSDLREAMRNPPHTGFHCYRAIEAMMQSMKEDVEEDDRTGWARLKSNLKIDRAVLDGIKAHADPPRHGKPHAMTDAERADVLKVTQVVVLRFLEYLTRGAGALPEAEFPILQA